MGKTEDKGHMEAGAARWLERRTECTRRSPAPVEQSVRSCLAAHAFARSGSKNLSYFQIHTGLPMVWALKRCGACPRGKALMTEYERQFGPWPEPNLVRIGHVRAEVASRRAAKTRAMPLTAIHRLAEQGYPN